MNATTTLSTPAALARWGNPLRAKSGKRSNNKSSMPRRCIVRSALTPKVPSEQAEAQAGDVRSVPGRSRDPLSAMMNFISDINPLASVFSSPSGEALPHALTLFFVFQTSWENKKIKNLPHGLYFCPLLGDLTNARIVCF